MEIQKSVSDKQMDEVFNISKGSIYAHLVRTYPLANDKKSLLAVSILFSQLILQEAICSLGNIDPEKDQAVMTETMSALGKIAAEYIEDAGGIYIQRFRVRSKKMKHYSSISFLPIWEYKYILSIGTSLPEEEIKKKAWELLDWLEDKALECAENIKKLEPKADPKSSNLSLDLVMPSEVKDSVKTDPENSPKKPKK
jgi:hypothetical protein